MEGKTINGYTLHRLLGTGGMAEVWYAENRIHKPAAVKLLSLDFAHNASIIDLSELPEKWCAFLETYLEKEPNNRLQLVEFEETVPVSQEEKTVAEPVIEVEAETTIEPEDEGTLVDELAPVVMPKQEPAPKAQAPKPKQEEVVSSKKTADSEKPKAVEKPKVIEKPEPLPFDANDVVFSMLKVGCESFVMGAFRGNDRVLRGGSWRDKANYCRVSARSFFAPINSYNGYGFRLAFDSPNYGIVVNKVDNVKVKPIFR